MSKAVPVPGASPSALRCAGPFTRLYPLLKQCLQATIPTGAASRWPRSSHIHPPDGLLHELLVSGLLLPCCHPPGLLQCHVGGLGSLSSLASSCNGPSTTQHDMARNITAACSGEALTRTCTAGTQASVRTFLGRRGVAWNEDLLRLWLLLLKLHAASPVLGGGGAHLLPLRLLPPLLPPSAAPQMPAGRHPPLLSWQQHVRELPQQLRPTPTHNPAQSHGVSTAIDRQQQQPQQARADCSKHHHPRSLGGHSVTAELHTPAGAAPA